MKKKSFHKRVCGHKLWCASPFPALAFLPTAMTRGRTLPSAHRPPHSPALSRALQRSKHLPELTNLLTQVLRHQLGDAGAQTSSHCHTRGQRAVLGWGLQKSPATPDARAAYQEKPPHCPVYEPSIFHRHHPSRLGLEA